MDRLHRQVSQTPMSLTRVVPMPSPLVCTYACWGSTCNQLKKVEKPKMVYKAVGMVCGYTPKLDRGCIIATFRSDPERQWGRKIIPVDPTVNRGLLYNSIYFCKC